MMPDINDYALHVLLRRLRSLQHYSLESEFAKYLASLQPKPFIDETIRAVLEGSRHGKALRLARLIGELHALGAFVGVRNSEQTMAFTSFCKEKDKIISIELQNDGNSTNGLKRFYIRSWINGVYLAYGRPKGKISVPMAICAQLRRVVERSSRSFRSISLSDILSRPDIGTSDLYAQSLSFQLYQLTITELVVEVRLLQQGQQQTSSPVLATTKTPSPVQQVSAPQPAPHPAPQP